MIESIRKPAGVLERPLHGARRMSAAAVIGSTGLVAISAHIAVPLGFTPVPITMQTFAVLLLGLLLPPREAFAALALYLAEGALGLPVFAPPGAAGAAQILGPTGGYLLSYPFAAAGAGMLYRRSRRGFAAALGAGGAAGLIILAAGAAWLGFLTRANLATVWTQSVAPFLPGDAVKLTAAAAAAGVLRSFRIPPDRSSV